MAVIIIIYGVYIATRHYVLGRNESELYCRPALRVAYATLLRFRDNVHTSSIGVEFSSQQS